VSEKNFIDYIRIFAHSGHGGAGCRHFLRNKLTAKGGPDGGDGGRGGHIILRGNAQLWTLLHLRYYKNVIADNGENGSKNNCTGKDGKDIIQTSSEFILACQCQTLGNDDKRRYKWTPNTDCIKSVDAIDCIAWTIQTNIAQGGIEKIVRQGDCIMIKPKAKYETLGRERHLSKQEYLKLLVAES
jgi:hypothetical protein